MKKILSARKIFKTYGDLKVLKNINIDVNDNEIIAIVGPSGAGKTTLLHILGTLDRPDKTTDSTIRFKNNDISKFSDKELKESSDLEEHENRKSDIKNNLIIISFNSQITFPRHFISKSLKIIILIKFN